MHGYDVGPMTHARPWAHLAGSGYVVIVAPPLVSPRRTRAEARVSSGLDLPNEAVDVCFVITAVLHTSLASMLQPADTAVVRHSDGADVTLMVGY